MSGKRKVKSFSCLDQFYHAMAFAQLTFRESLRDIEACATQGKRLHHLGFRSPVARNTLANASDATLAKSMPIWRST